MGARAGSSGARTGGGLSGPELVRRSIPAWIRPVARRTYWLARGRYPRQLAEVVLAVKARNPQTFNEKILHKMAKDRDPALTLYADKVAVRSFVADRVGASALPEVIGVFDRPEEIPKDALPTNFVIKPSHASAAFVICWEGNDLEARIDKDPETVTWEHFLIHPRNLDWNAVSRLAQRWLAWNYGYVMGQDLPEWAYRDITPRLIVEEVLLDAHGRLPQDYKFFMFDGKCKMIQVDSSRFDGHRRDLFDPRWERLHASYGYPPSTTPPPRPSELDEMLRIAGVLSKGTDFIRVDLYATTKGVKFGELTNYPAGGMKPLHPRSFDIWLGSDWVPTY